MMIHHQTAKEKLAFFHMLLEPESKTYTNYISVAYIVK